MGTPTLFPPESDHELLALRRRCASALWALAPRPVGRLFFGGSAAAWLARWLNRAAGDDQLPQPRSGPAPNADANTDTGTNTNSSGSSWAADPGDHPGPAASPSAANNQRAHVNGGGGPELGQQLPQPQQRDPDARIISEIEAGILDVFSDPYCNKHLMYGVLELVLVRLVPELAEKGVVELWEERLS